MLLCVVHDNHRSVVQVGDTLTGFLSFLDDLDRHALSGQHNRLEGVGQLVDVQDFDALQFRNLVQVEIIGDDLGVQFFRQGHQFRVHTLQLREVVIADLDVHADAPLHAVQNVQTPSSPRPFHGVRGIGNVLQLVQNEARHDQIALQKSGVRNVGDPAVNDDAGVDDANVAAVLWLAQTEKTELFDFLRPD